MKPVLIIDGKKRCSKCKQNKPISKFHKCIKSKSGFASQCKDCRAPQGWIYNRTMRRQRIALKSHVKGHYDLTIEEYDQLIKKQNGRCVICDGINADGRRLSIDHNHKNGVLRGLLCHHCNTALGLVRDNINVLKNMIEYLQNNN